MLAAEVGSMTASGECVKERCSLAVKTKFGIDGLRFAAPEAAEFGADVSVKRSVDFDDVEKAGEIFDGMDFLARDFGRVENAVPIFVRPAGGADADSRGLFHNAQARWGKSSTGSC